MSTSDTPEAGWNPIQPTADLAERAFGQLAAGETGQEFLDIAGHLQCCAREPHAMCEGTLLLAGAELHATVQGLAKAIQTGEAAYQRPTNMTNMFSYLDWVEMSATSRGLRPVGSRILDHCLELSPNDEVTRKLELIKALDMDSD